MGSPFTVTSVSNYNANPPSDDGSQTAANRVQWSTQKTKLADPIKTAFDSSETTTSTAFSKIPGGATITTTAISYGVSASDQGKLVKATASGITITTPDATVVGAPFYFRFLNASSGDVTFVGSGTQTVDGDLTFTVPAGCGFVCDTDGSNWFTNGRNFNSVLAMPQGYLTLTSGTPVITGDVTAATAIYYTIDQGDRVPISTDGVTFKMRQFSELTLTLVANHLANTAYDVFVFDNSGTITIGTGPAWNSTAARGTGAGTTELQRVHGIYTNKNAMTARNGATTYSVAANEGTYVGSILIDGTAGQISCHRSSGQLRKWGVWNAFNRKRISMMMVDPSPSWVVSGSGWQYTDSNNSGDSIKTFIGLPEEQIVVDLRQGGQVTGVATTQTGEWAAGISENSATTVVASTLFGTLQTGATSIGSIGTVFVSYTAAPSIGLKTYASMEQVITGTGTLTMFGGIGGQMLRTDYRG